MMFAFFVNVGKVAGCPTYTLCTLLWTLQYFRRYAGCTLEMWHFVILFQIETELKDICNDVLDIIDKHLIPNASQGESKVFYYKMWVLGRLIDVE